MNSPLKRRKSPGQKSHPENEWTHDEQSTGLYHQNSKWEKEEFSRTRLQIIDAAASIICKVTARKREKTAEIIKISVKSDTNP